MAINDDAAPHEILDRHVRDALRRLDDAAPRPADGAPALTPDALKPDALKPDAIFDAMAGSRLLDIWARRLRARGQGYYTIGSAGHESNTAVAAALRTDDPALLHYRSGGFFLARQLQAGRSIDDGLLAVLRSMFGATTDPASGGRHKVFGDPELAIIPQTSTIASHLPRAVGVGFAIARGHRIGADVRWPADAIAVASFGDASLNHSTAAGALNAAAHTAWQGVALPLLFVCEDNGLGISVPTPAGWVAAALPRPGLAHFSADGDDPDALARTAAEAVAHVRATRRPATLHLRCVRFLGHAGTDLESGYRAAAEIAAELVRDPLLAHAAAHGIDGAADRYAELSDRIAELAGQVATEPTLRSAAQVMAPLGAASPARRAAPAPTPPATGRTLAQAINAALDSELAARPEMLIFGEDVGRKGGVYGVTKGLQERHGRRRVFDTLLDEQSILGLGLGLGVSGLLGVPEIQYLAYLHNAEDQLRGEAASLRFFSNDGYRNPMVVRIAGLAYQKGFGGHFHNDNALAVLRDIPGLLVGVPARPEDAAPMLAALLDAAARDGRVGVLVEPIALYHEKDLHQPGDRGWLGTDHDQPAPIGAARRHGDGTDLTIVTFGNGLRMSLRAAHTLAAEGIGAQVLDLRWLSPLPTADLLAAARATGRVLIADETRASGGVGEGVAEALRAGGYAGALARVASRDSYVPLGAAANLVLLGEDDITTAARTLLAPRSPGGGCLAPPPATA
ncbi:2-oxoisovalerate dehydrogenase E1 component [Naumannella cuiyingiana]|uniref:2-oxoisovalerate dehydrogenase E1 component n=1 Tax=Naumannella cuiyingiana TaxID=1347891 RepID=A0A7Z0D8X3_9ACTN|nr:transketolase C-terminal domain-containing protein [Naumannella cuiyingiana]NYI71110.1 2-oxoisovalerate dehydrogenase E1 component [Naumannella cuiyingiana]